MRDVRRHRTAIVAAVVAVVVGTIAIATRIATPRVPADAAPIVLSQRAPASESPVDAEGANGDRRDLGLREMSQSFRHSTLLTAIRRAGFYCDEVVEAHESAEDVWLASCRDLKGFTVSAHGINAVRVEPIAHNVDSVF
jgi:hypothetical protein